MPVQVRSHCCGDDIVHNPGKTVGEPRPADFWPLGCQCGELSGDPNSNHLCPDCDHTQK